MELKTQICSCCHEEKPVTEFFRHPSTKSGYDSRCKACVTKRAKELRQRRKLLTPPIYPGGIQSLPTFKTANLSHVCESS